MTRPAVNKVPHACFLTWLEHRRTRELGARLGIDVIELISRHGGWRRYVDLIPATIRVLWQRKPRVVLVQTPSIILAALTVVLRAFLGYKLLFDAHNEAIKPIVHTQFVAVMLARWLLPRADRVLVTNHQLAEAVTGRGGRPMVLWDPLPRPTAVSAQSLPGRFRIAVISTYAPDEPFNVVLEAARAVSNDVQFFVTGDPAELAEAVRASVPPNVTLTGFLNEPAYWSLLASCDAVMDLTTMDACLVCGAYEAIAVGRPLVLSDNAVSRDVFGGFGEFADNTPRGVVEALTRLRDRYADIVAALPDLRRAYEDRWSAQASALRAFIVEE
jgi:glycosyltransferase involved in cell wall biosynthesis